MNADYEKQLEAQIDRELKQLPELSAPASLVSRVMKRVEAQQRLPWYSQPWIKWPVPLRVATLAGLAGLFALVTFLAWNFLASDAWPSVDHALGEVRAQSTMVWDTVSALVNAGVLAVKHLGTGFMVACLTVSFFSYLACIGLGTLAVRFAVAKR
jgi:hypothetical protein